MNCRTTPTAAIAAFRHAPTIRIPQPDRLPAKRDRQPTDQRRGDRVAPPAVPRRGRRRPVGAAARAHRRRHPDPERRHPGPAQVPRQRRQPDRRRQPGPEGAPGRHHQEGVRGRAAQLPVRGGLLPPALPRPDRPPVPHREPRGQRR